MRSSLWGMRGTVMTGEVAWPGFTQPGAADGAGQAWPPCVLQAGSLGACAETCCLVTHQMGCRSNLPYDSQHVLQRLWLHIGCQPIRILLLIQLITRVQHLQFGHGVSGCHMS
jgi:hypothetical protein